MRATDPKTAEAMERVEQAIAEVEQAARAYFKFLKDWRLRNGVPLESAREDSDA